MPAGSCQSDVSWCPVGRPEPAAFRAEPVFQVAESLCTGYVVISLNWWNTSLGSYGLNLKNFPEGIVSLGRVADQAHARGLKLGIHVMTRSITKRRLGDPPARPASADRRRGNAGRGHRRTAQEIPTSSRRTTLALRAVIGPIAGPTC